MPHLRHVCHGPELYLVVVTAPSQYLVVSGTESRIPSLALRSIREKMIIERIRLDTEADEEFRVVLDKFVEFERNDEQSKIKGIKVMEVEVGWGRGLREYCSVVKADVVVFIS